jgi:hypothetical protein
LSIKKRKEKGAIIEVSDIKNRREKNHTDPLVRWVSISSRKRRRKKIVSAIWFNAKPWMHNTTLRHIGRCN